MKGFAKFQGLIASFALIATVAVAGFGGDVALARGDTSANAVVKGGTFSKSEVIQASKQKDVNAVFAQYGITEASIKNAKEGVVSKDGKVTVDGKVVATGAQSVGRQKLGTDSTAFAAGGTTFYSRPTQTSFNSNQLAAYVIVDQNGQFVSAIIKDCGNPVKATPVKVKKVEPVYTCDALTVTPVKGSKNEYQFTLKGSASNGAKITGYSFGTGDGYGKKSSTPTVTYTYKQPGTYKVEGSVVVDVEGKTQQVTGANCAKTITIPKEEVKKTKVCDTTTNTIVEIEETQANDSRYSTNTEDCKPAPVTPVVEKKNVCDLTTKQMVTINEDQYDASKHGTADDCKEEPQEIVELPRTGAADVMMSGFGLASLTGAGYAYLRSRKSL